MEMPSIFFAVNALMVQTRGCQSLNGDCNIVLIDG